MSGHLKYVLTADMSPDEKMLVTGGADKALNLWEIPSGRLLGHLQGHTSDVETRNSGLLSIYVDGKEIPRSEAEFVVQYIGRGIVIIEKEE